MKNPSRNIMNKLARSVLSLYSYDENPDDLSLDNVLLQSVKLVGAFPSIVANAYSVKRHYFERGLPAHPLPHRGPVHRGELPADDPPQHQVHQRRRPACWT